MNQLGYVTNKLNDSLEFISASQLGYYFRTDPIVYRDETDNQNYSLSNLNLEVGGHCLICEIPSGSNSIPTMTVGCAEGERYLVTDGKTSFIATRPGNTDYKSVYIEGFTTYFVMRLA